MKLKKILTLSPIPTHLRSAGHRERIYQMLRQMQAFGHEVHLLYVTLEADGDLAAMRECWGDRLHLFQYDINHTPFQCSPSFHATCIGKCIRRIGFRFGKTINFPYAADDWYDHRLDQRVRELQTEHHFDMVFSEYLFLSKAFLQFSDGVRKVLDTIDVLTNRHHHYTQHGQPPVWFSTTKQEERKALRRADVIIAIQDHERRFFQELVPDKPVVTIGHLMELQPLPLRTEPPLTLLLLASANETNIYGLQWFLRDIWPIVHNQQSEVRLLVAGPICATIPDDPTITKYGMYADHRIYASADIVISPILFGTGLKIKNIEALGYAKPLVTTLVGAEGLEQGINSAFFATATAEAFTHRITELITSAELRRKISSQAYCFAEQFQQQNLSILDRIVQGDLFSCQNH